MFKSRNTSFVICAIRVAAGVPLRDGLLRSTSTLTPERSYLWSSPLPHHKTIVVHFPSPIGFGISDSLMGCKILQVVSESSMSGVRVSRHAFCKFVAGVAAIVLLREGLLRSPSILAPKRSSLWLSHCLHHKTIFFLSPIDFGISGSSMECKILQIVFYTVSNPW